MRREAHDGVHEDRLRVGKSVRDGRDVERGRVRVQDVVVLLAGGEVSRRDGAELAVDPPLERVALDEKRQLHELLLDLVLLDQGLGQLHIGVVNALDLHTVLGAEVGVVDHPGRQKSSVSGGSISSNVRRGEG